MRGYQLGTIWGIPIRVHLSLLIVLPILAYLLGSGAQIETYAALVNALAGTSLDPAALRQGSTPWLIGSAAAIGLFVSVAVHELGHAWMAMRYDLEVESITLWILGGLAALKEFPKEWNREFWIAVVGPLTSIALAGVLYAALFAIPASAPVVLFVVGWLAVTNLVLAVFNMVPAFPMDGGRVLRALLARNRPYASATRIAARIGSAFAVVFAVFGVLAFSPLLLLLALFIYGAASTESRTVALGELLEGMTVGDVASPLDATIEGSASVDELVSRMFADRVTEFVVSEGGEPVGLITAADFKAVSLEDRSRTTVAELMETDVVHLASDTPAFDALVALDGSGASAAFVDGPEGSRVVSRADFTAAMEMRRVIGSGAPL